MTERPPPLVRLWFVLVGVILNAGASAIAVEAPAGNGDAWALVLRADGSADVVHLRPPGDSDGAGVAYLATRLRRVPERITAWDDTVYLVLRPQGGGPSSLQRRVLSMRAVPVGGSWRYDPPLRPMTLNSIAGERDVVDVDACSFGPLALTRPGAGLSLQLHSDGAWRELPVPEAITLGDDGTRLLIAGGEHQVSMLACSGDVATLYRSELERTPGRGATVVGWQQHELADAFDGAIPFEMVEVDGYLLAIWRGEPGSIVVGDVRRWDADRWTVDTVATIGSTPPEDPLVMARRGRAGLVLAWLGAPPAERDAAVEPGRIIELSASGRILHDGSVNRASPVSGREVRLLTILLILGGITIAISIMRPEGVTEVVWPEGYVLALPLQRLVAAMIDFSLSMVPAGLFLGISPGVLMRPDAISGDQGWWLLLIASAIAFVHTTIGESINGRSIGKLIAGCKVVTLRPDRAGKPPRFWESFVRNIVRWSLPLLTISILLDPVRRHVGDYAGRTAVVTRTEATDDEG